jgi:hypothetical protein
MNKRIVSLIAGLVAWTVVFLVVVVAPVAAAAERFNLSDGTKIVVSQQQLRGQVTATTYTLKLNGLLNMSTAKVVDDVLVVPGLVSRVTTIQAPGGAFQGAIKVNTAPRYKWRKKWAPFTVSGWDNFVVPSDSRGNFSVLLGQHIRISLEITAEEMPETTWYFRIVPPPAPAVVESTPPVFLHPPTVCNVPEGDYLHFYWRGTVTPDGVPSVDPRYPVTWKAVASSIEFSLVFYQWELWGDERTPGRTTGTDQPSVPLNAAADGVAVTLGDDLKRLNLPPVGEVTLGFLHKGVAQIQAGCWPRINVVNDPGATLYSATLSRRSGKWVWTSWTRQN